MLKLIHMLFELCSEILLLHRNTFRSISRSSNARKTPIRPEDWRLIIIILDELQVDVGALSRTEARGVLYVLGSVYEDRLVKREFSVAKAFCSRFSEANVNPIDAVLRHLMLSRVF